jgi:hypothetical protein
MESFSSLLLKIKSVCIDVLMNWWIEKRGVITQNCNLVLEAYLILSPVGIILNLLRSQGGIRIKIKV